MKIRNVIFVTAVMLLMIACAVLCVGAEEPAVLYTLTHEDGTVEARYTAEEFKSDLETLTEDISITLCGNIKIDGGITFVSTVDNPRTVNIDLAGYGIYCLYKTTIFNVRNYTTLNIYSTAPDSFLYVTDVDVPTQGGCICIVQGVGALVNMGAAVKLGDGREDYGITTFSSCFADIRGNGTIGFNLDGGRHFANIADWAGFINPRNGDGTMTIKNADIIVQKNNNLIHSEDENTTLYFENCNIVKLDGSSSIMFYSVNGNIVFKDCVSNYSFSSNTSGVIRSGCVTLEGKNVFGADNGYNELFIKGGAGKISAKTSLEYELKSGGIKFWMFDQSGSLSKQYLTLPELTDAYVIADPEDTYECIWEYNKQKIIENWMKNETPTPPIALSEIRIDGLYRYGWFRDYSYTEGVKYIGGPVVDFGIKISCEYGEYVAFHIIIPDYIIDEAYISFARGSIDGVEYKESDWTAREIDGKKYYEYIVDVFDPDPDAIIEINIPCDLNDGTKYIQAEGRWRITLGEYIERAYATRDEHTEGEMAVVDRLYNDFVASLDESEPDAKLPEDDDED